MSEMSLSEIHDGAVNTVTMNPNLVRVHWDNVRDNQIGGVTDGISAETATDIGFDTDFVAAVERARVDAPHLKYLLGRGACYTEGHIEPVVISQQAS